MQMKISEIEKRLAELETLADEVAELTHRQTSGLSVQPELSIKGWQWYRGARELLVVNDLPMLDQFDACFGDAVGSTALAYSLSGICCARVGSTGEKRDYSWVAGEFQKVRSIVLAAVEEFRSRLLSLKSILSYSVSADAFDNARSLLEAGEDEATLRAGGVVAKVALERHLLTVADSRCVTIPVNPPTKQKPDPQDVLSALTQANVLTAPQAAELGGLFAIGSNCTRPSQPVKREDVQRLIMRGRHLVLDIL